MSDEKKKLTGAAKFIRWILVVLVVIITVPALKNKLEKREAEENRVRAALIVAHATIPSAELSCTEGEAYDNFLNGAWKAGWHYAYVTVPASCSAHTAWIVRPHDVRSTFFSIPEGAVEEQLAFRGSTETEWKKISPVKNPPSYEFVEGFRWRNQSATPIRLKILMD